MAPSSLKHKDVQGPMDAGPKNNSLDRKEEATDGWVLDRAARMNPENPVGCMGRYSLAEAEERR